VQEVQITEKEAGQRLDKFAHRHLGKPPKSFVQKLLRKKSITVNGKKADGAHLLIVGDVVRLFVSEETINRFAAPVKTFPKGEVDIIYEDDHVILVNKPANLLTQPDAPGGDSLVGRLRQEGNGFQPVTVNRLDRNTTGLVICAKTLASAQVLSELMADRKIQKIYMGVASGKIAEEMTLRGTHTKDKARNVVSITDGEKGKDAHTHIIPLKYDAVKDATLLEIHLHTGRSHQIRAHLQSIGHPLLGDVKYGGVKAAGRQLLHAHRIIFPVMGGILSHLSNKTFTAPLPFDIRSFL